ncbi:hypothetical protein VE00_09581 [Pseudogymnoascus sp. WSF 3629]|jgi:hypothetical protein|nr:hypothetical protein VE00_09581 [Pseudogymnoascus sp. WSF 3629]
MHIPLLTTTLLLLTSLTPTLALPSPSPNANIEARQQQAPIQTITCADYSRIANYTAIDSNSTLRAAFLQASPQGTDPTRVILDRASVEFKAKNLKFDKALNTRCGNLSTVALREVNTNFSRGVVAGWKVAAPVGAEIGAGREVLCVAVFVVMYIGFGACL